MDKTSVVIFVAALTAASKQLLELVEFDLTRAILIDFQDKILNVNGHFELVLDGVDQLIGINEAITIRLAAHGHERLEQLFLSGATFRLSLFLYEFFELIILDSASVFWVCRSDHQERFLFIYLFTKMFKSVFEVTRSHVAHFLVIEGHESVPDLVLG